MRATIFSLLSGLLLQAMPAAEIQPGKPFDYPSKAFYPKRWIEKKLTAPMLPWIGEEIALVTPDKEYDSAAISNFVGHLDSGWRLYGELIGERPRMLKNFEGAPTIVALPHNGLSCGYGCGYVGASGIEMSNFDKHLAGSVKDPLNIPHAYFYEMGRNYFVFGHRHSCFTTGFAVFIRYVCTDTLKLNDGDKLTRQTIDEAIARFEKNEMSFIDAMTNHGPHGEKGNRLKDEDGREISPSDQPVIYASLMLQLRKEFGANDFFERFYKQLLACPAIEPVD
ncbi:MAG: hypothetical protein ACI8XO_003605 [Verrucomicrobiales bacterium]|jgi:hypothetical protein